VVIRSVTRLTFLDPLRREPAAMDGLLGTLADLVGLGNARHADVLGLDVPGRLAKWLLVLAERGKPKPDGVVVALQRTEGELAEELATSRSTLNRALHELEGLGLIAVEGDQVTIHNREGSAAFLGWQLLTAESRQRCHPAGRERSAEHLRGVLALSAMRRRCEFGTC
jgi:CRP-like cAMP-binding protein